MLSYDCSAVPTLNCKTGATSWAAAGGAQAMAKTTKVTQRAQRPPVDRGGRGAVISAPRAMAWTRHTMLCGYGAARGW